MQTIKSIDCTKVTTVPIEVLTSKQPLLLKGMASHWPLVNAGKSSNQSAANYILQFDNNIPLTAYTGLRANSGRYFYNENMTGFNFERVQITLGKVIDTLLMVSKETVVDHYYVGSTMIDHWLPTLRQENDLGLDHLEPLISLWLGNESRIAAHYDFPNNIACNVVGCRKFTLFPPEQADNLYVGPVDFTPSGQSISLVDACQPDFIKFPKYQQALEASFTVELEPSDGIFIPSMWWHHVHALGCFNVLVNYWWRSTPAYLGSPTNALQLAMLTLHDLPKEQLLVWKNLFDTYVFNSASQDFSHIPPAAQGMLNNITKDQAQLMRARLSRFIK